MQTHRRDRSRLHEPIGEAIGPALDRGIEHLGRVRMAPQSGPATRLLKAEARIAREHGSWIAVANAADKVRLDSRAGEKRLVHAGVVEARHRAAVQSQRPRGDDEVSTL